MKKYDVIIVGGGAAGLACGVHLADNSKFKILILEAGERAGKKLAATGNGQGNASNIDMSVGHYRSGNIAAVEKIVCNSDGLEAFQPMLFSADGKGRVYPSGRQASALVDTLLRKISTLGIDLKLCAKVTDIKAPSANRNFEVALESGEKYSAEHVVLAMGGKAQKQFKTDGSAYKLAERLGHRITPLYPSLVQLKTDTAHTKTLKGIRTECKVTAVVGEQAVRTEVGDVIFTEYGVSGNAIFYISPAFSDRRGQLIIDLLPEFSAEQIYEILEKRIKEGCPTAEILSGLVHNQIGRAVIRRAATGNVQKIISILKNFTLEVTGTLGFDYAQVTHGGVDMRDISDNLESKIVKNLYFAGEILDVDGDCGGYNLHWAFTSAQTVAHAIVDVKKRVADTDK